MSGFGPASVPRLVVPPQSLPRELRMRAFDWDVYFSITGQHTCAELARQGDQSLTAIAESLDRLEAWGLVGDELLSLSAYLSSAAACEVEQPFVENPPPYPGFEPLSLEEEDAVPANISTMQTAPSRNLSLRAVMNALMERSPDPDAGQLDVYRTFLRVDPGLLRRNGITTLHFEDDRLVSDPELLEAIVDSAARTLGERLPAAVFVAAE